MTRRTGIGLDKIRQRGFSGEGLPAGMAKDKLIFIIICSAAIAIAVVTMAFTLFPGRSGSKIRPSQWQCLDCGHEFSKDTREPSPIECEKCAGEAVKVNRRKCPECGEDVLVWRMRLTEQGQAQYQKMKELSGQMPVMLMGPGAAMGLPMESQLWVQQDDGSYGWTDWFVASGPQMGQAYSFLKCSKCDAPLYRPRDR